MTAQTPGIIVYRHSKNGSFCIQRLSVDREGFTTWVGDLLRLSLDKMRTEGLKVIQNSLSEFGRLNARQGSELMRLPSKERSRFLSAHSSVGIDLPDTSTLSFAPMQKTKGGGVGKAEDRFTLKLPTTPETFYEALGRAFEQANECARSMNCELYSLEMDTTGAGSWTRWDNSRRPGS